MAKFAIVRTGGKQFLVKENDVIYVDKIDGDKDAKITLETLGTFDDAGESVEIGTPVLTAGVGAIVVEQVKGDKVRINKFKAKVRYRRQYGFRAELTKIKILSI
jgi:large subunit ribosomal protein L21